MAECSFCGRRRAFLSLNKNGMCKSCEDDIDEKIIKSKKVIQDALKLIKISDNDHVKIKNCETITNLAQNMLGYEMSGIINSGPLPSKLIQEYSLLRDKIIARPFAKDLSKSLNDIEVSLSKFIQISSINDLLIKIKEARDLLIDKEPSMVIAISNHKGGVGKTTSTINIGGGFAQLGKKVLLIDFDPQANLTDGLGKERKKNDNTVYNMLKGEVSLEELKIRINDNLYLLPSNLILAKLEREYSGPDFDVYMLRNCIRQSNEFDYILIDCPPSLSFLTMNAFASSNEVIIPLQPEYYSLKGIYKLLDAIEFVKMKINKSLYVLGIIGTRFDKRTTLHNEVLEKIRENLGDKIFNSTIRENISLAEASSYGKTIFDYEPHCHGAEDYMSLCQEIITRNNTQHNNFKSELALANKTF